VKTRQILFLMVVVVFVCCVAAPTSFGCSQPGTTTQVETWPANAAVGIIGVPGQFVPSGPLGTAIANWNIALTGASSCTPIFQSGGTNITMNYASIPPPSPCPTGSTCYTRGLTDFSRATFTINGRLASVPITINSQVTATAAITEVVAHELGHTFGLADCNYPGCPVGSSVMESAVSASGTTINSAIGQPGPTSCDITAVMGFSPDYTCPPPPPPPPRCCKCNDPNTAKGKQLYNDFAFRKVQSGADGCQLGWSTTCCGSTPIIIDTTGNGFVLTSAVNGVKFDISGTGTPVQVSWTAPDSGNAFLCLPDANGACDDGKDLFGDKTSQPPSATPNGFAALAVYDNPANGGNGDDIIDSRDAIFSSLRLWIDSNHDGISQPDEIYTLPSLGVNSISLNYKLDSRTDQYGNVFRYRAQVNPGGATSTGRMAYDVFFTTLSGGNTITAQSCPAANPQTKQGALTKNRR